MDKCTAVGGRNLLFTVCTLPVRSRKDKHMGANHFNLLRLVLGLEAECLAKSLWEDSGVTSSEHRVSTARLLAITHLQPHHYAFQLPSLYVLNNALLNS